MLDIGCFDGFLLSHINATRKIGIDTDILKKYPDIEYIKGDFMTYNFNNNKFDNIFSFDVIEHVKDDKIFIEKIIELLSVGGNAILSTPCENIRIFPSILQGWVNKKWGHIYRKGYTPQKIKNLVIDNNSIELNFIEWNCPTFRSLYLILSLLWKISPFITKKLLLSTIERDIHKTSGNNGFFFFEIRK